MNKSYLFYGKNIVILKGVAIVADVAAGVCTVPEVALTELAVCGYANTLSNGKVPLSGYYRHDMGYWQSHINLKINHKGGSIMKNNELGGGIDIGSELHRVAIRDEEGKVFYEKEVPHRFSAFHKFIEEVKEIEKEKCAKVVFGMEGKNGYAAPFDRILLDAGFTLYNIDNLALKRFRNIFGAESKNDKRDARMLSKLVGLREQFNDKGEKAFIPVKKSPGVHEKLKVLSRHQQRLIKDKTKLINRLKKALLEVCPGMLDIFKDVDSKKLLRLLVAYPDFSEYKGLTKEKVLRIRGIGKTRIDEIVGSLQGLAYVEGLTDVYAKVIKSLANHILELREEIEEIDKELEVIGEGSKDVQILMSIPGVSVKLSSRLMGEIGDIEHFDNPDQLAVYCGVGCIDNSSGKRKGAKSVYKANKFCKATMVNIAGCTIKEVKESQNYYLKKRKEGKDHNKALRNLARQMAKVIFWMLKEKRDYYVSEKYHKRIA